MWGVGSQAAENPLEPLVTLGSWVENGLFSWQEQTPLQPGEALKGLDLKVLLLKHRSIACPLPLALASDLPCGVCTCKWDLQLLSPGWLWTDFPRPRGWRVTTALGNPFPCGTALGNPLPCRKSQLFAKSPFR